MRGCECEEFSGLGGGELGLGVRVLWSPKIMPPPYGGAFVSLHSGKRCWIGNAGGSLDVARRHFGV